MAIGWLPVLWMTIKSINTDVDVVTGQVEHSIVYFTLNRRMASEEGN